MLSYEQVQHKPRVLQSLTGLNIGEFEQLLVSFEQVWQEYLEEHYIKPGQQRRYGGGRTVLSQEFLMTNDLYHSHCCIEQCE